MTNTIAMKNHLKEYFENFSQTLFFKDAVFGFLLMMLSLGFKPELFFPGLFASIVGYIYSTSYRTPKILKQTGLLTINGFFFGIALASHFQHNTQFYFFLAVGALAIPLATKAVFEVMQHWKLTPLVAPYILSVWVLWLCIEGTGLRPTGRFWVGGDSLLPTLFPIADAWLSIVWSVFYSMGQIFFFQNSEYGLSLLLLISIFSPRRGLFFFLGTALAAITFHQLTNGSAWQTGYFSFSAGLVGLGLASFPERFNWKTILLFCVLSLFFTLASERLLRGFNLPLLSLPYVLTFWFAMLSRVPRLNVSWAPAAQAQI